MKKFFKKYGATIIFYSILIAIFLLGFVIGFYGRSAPDALTADFGTQDKTTEAAQIPETDIKTVATTPAREYNEIMVTATAYCPCAKCCGKTDGITATGTKATAGRTIAVDPSIIPYGTEVIINGNTYIAEDCGGAVNGAMVDIFFNTHEEALQWGKKQIIATITK